MVLVCIFLLFYLKGAETRVTVETLFCRVTTGWITGGTIGKTTRTTGRSLEGGGGHWGQFQKAVKLPFRCSRLPLSLNQTSLLYLSYLARNPEPRLDTAVRPASRHHLRTHTPRQYSGSVLRVHTVITHYGDRGYPPCSSSLLEPALPSSQQLLMLVPLPDIPFPPR